MSLAVCVLSGALAMFQPPPVVSVPRSRPGQTSLLQDERVLRELKIDGTQRRKIAEAFSSFGKLVNDTLQREKEEAEQEGRPVRSSLGVSTIEFEQHVKRILSPAQSRRLVELRLQLRGIRALRDPAFQESLNIGPDQAAMIDEILRALHQGELDRRKEVDETHQTEEAEINRIVDAQAGDRDVAALRRLSEASSARNIARLAAIRKQTIESDRRALDELRRHVLTRKQWQTWQRKLGEPFDFDKVDAPEKPGASR